MTLRQNALRLLRTKISNDSFWSVFGNGLGHALLLLVGILIARYLGSNLYGEYGMIKGTMFYIAAFSTFGLGVTSTRYVAKYLAEDPSHVRSIVRDCLCITLWVAIALTIIILIIANPISQWLHEPQLERPLRCLGLIIICRAIVIVQRGILGGLKAYRASALNIAASGIIMLSLSIPLTLILSLNGALISLLAAQMANALLNHLSIRRRMLRLSGECHRSFVRELLAYSLPVAIQETTFFISNWGGLLILTRYSHFSQVGIYSAASQWQAIILFIPSMLVNVIVSHISSNLHDRPRQRRILRTMLRLSLACTIAVALPVAALAPWLTTIYGPSYSGMAPVIIALALTALFSATANVYHSILVAHGRNWLLLGLRSIRDTVFLGVAILLLTQITALPAALAYALALLLSTALFLLLIALCPTSHPSHAQ